MEIYILIDNKPQGPYAPEAIRRNLATGRLKPTDLAAYAGSADWKPLSAMIQSWNQTAAGAAASGKSSKRNLIIAMAGVGVILLAGAAVFLISKSHGTNSPNAAADLSRSPLPQTLAELNTWYAEPPEGQNAAAYFDKAFAQFDITDADQKSKDLPVIGQGQWPQPGAPLSASAKASMAALVQRNAAAWSALEQGVGFEQARYPIDLNLGPETLLPDLIKVKRTALVAQLKAALEADGNQPKAAANTLLVSLAVAESLKDEPVLISQLVRVADHAIGVATLEQMMNSVALSRDDLERLSAAFGKAESSQARGEGFSRALVGERVMSLSLFDMPADKLQATIKADQSQHLSDEAVAKMMENLKAQRAFAEETFDHALSLRRKPLPERLEVDQYFPARANEARKRGYLLCHLLFSGLGKSTEREAKGLANLRLAQTAIALEQFRRENGNYPDSLAALVPKFLPEVPVDPAKGEKFRYEKVGAGYEVSGSAINSPKALSFKVVTPPQAAM